MIELERVPWPETTAPREDELRRRLIADGFDVMVWSDPPRRVYTPHAHDHDECLWCIRGSIVFRIAGTAYSLAAGDRLLLPRGTTHAAEAGPDGATYLIGEKS